MKRFFGFAIVLFMISAPAFAGPKPSTVTIPEKVLVGTTAVPAGSYKLTVTGDGPVVQVTLTQQDKTIATFSAKQVNQKGNPGVQTYTHGGAVVLQTISLSKFSLTVEGAPQPGQ